MNDRMMQLPETAELVREGDGPASWRQEREMLLEMLAQQQRVAQAGLVTSGLAHDVRNHVMVLSGSADLALTSNDPRQWQEALEQIKERCRDLSEVTSAFLSFVRRQRVNEHEAFRVGEAVKQACVLASPLAGEHRVNLKHSVIGEFVITGESRLLVQALVNLVSNAVRACDGGQGEVSIVVAPMMGRLCRIEVCDNGPGIPEDVRRRLFRPFATGNANRGGTGMGLFIVRQAVRRLGGSIRVRTSPRGTRFQIDFPTP